MNGGELEYGAAVKITTRTGTAKEYRFSFGFAIDEGATPAELYDSRVLSLSPLAQEITAPDQLFTTLAGISVEVSLRAGDLLLDRGLAGVRLDGAAVEVFLTTDGAFSSALDGEGFATDLVWRGRIDPASVKFTRSALSFNATDPRKDALGYPAPVRDFTEDEWPDAAEQAWGKLYTVFAGFLANGRRYQEAQCIDTTNATFTACDPTDWKGDAVFKVEISGAASDTELGEYESGSFFAMRSDHVDETNLGYNQNPTNPALRCVIEHNITNVDEDAGTFRIRTSDHVPEDKLDCKTNGIYCNADEGDPEADPPVPNGEQPVYTEDVDNGDGTTTTVEVKNKDFLLAYDLRQMCIIFYYPGDRLFGKTCGSIRYQRPDLTGTYLRPDTCGEWAYVLLHHYGAMEAEWFHLPDFVPESKWTGVGAMDSRLELPLVLGILNERRSVEEWINALLWECGAVLSFERGKMRLRYFNPTAEPDAVALTIGPDEIAPDSVAFTNGGWGERFNRLTVQENGHPTMPGAAPFITCTRSDTLGDHADPPSGRGVVPFSGGTYRALWMNVKGGAEAETEKAAFRDRVQAMVDLAALDKQILTITYQPARANSRAAMNLVPGQTVGVWWDPRDEFYGPMFSDPLISQEAPRVFLILSTKKNLLARTVELNLLDVDAFV